MHRIHNDTRDGLPSASQGEPFLPGPTFAAPYHAAGDPAQAPFTYGRFHNPTWARFEQALSELERGSVLVFASGMAAVSAVFGTVLRPKDIAVLPSDNYYTTRVIAQGYFTEMGVQVRMAPTAGNALGECLDGAKLLWLESPSNPGLDVCDIAALTTQAHTAGAFVAVDNTTPTILGHVAVRDTEWADRLLTWRTQGGAVAGPMEVWLAHRSLATLGVRLDRQCRNAHAIAAYLATRPEVSTVRYPGLPTDHAHILAKRQMQLFGPIVSFVVADQGHAERFLQSCELVYEATGFGGIHTTAERRARWGGDNIPAGFIRLSAGCENTEDLLNDLAHALDTAGHV